MELQGTPETRAISGTSGTPGTPDASPERLRALAAQFESLLLSQMLKEMRASMFDDEGETGLGSGPLADTLFSELSLALSRTGGIGLADSVLNPLVRQTGLGQATPTVAGPVTSGYGWRQDPIDGGRKFHKGIDIALPVGQDVPAVQGGRVSFAGEQSGYGLTVVVDHADGRATRYAHLSGIDVQVGQEVDAGQRIARSGASGRATGPHLHVEVIEAGRTVNPAEMLRSYVQPAATGR